jgi:hypothetical protein
MEDRRMTLKNKTTKTQCKKLLKYLKSHKRGISARDALLTLGIERESARIWDLRHAGHVIDKEWYKYENEDGNTVRFCKYILIKEAV